MIRVVHITKKISLAKPFVKYCDTNVEHTILSPEKIEGRIYCIEKIYAMPSWERWFDKIRLKYLPRFNKKVKGAIEIADIIQVHESLQMAKIMARHFPEKKIIAVLQDRWEIKEVPEGITVITKNYIKAHKTEGMKCLPILVDDKQRGDPMKQNYIHFAAHWIINNERDMELLADKIEKDRMKRDIVMLSMIKREVFHRTHKNGVADLSPLQYFYDVQTDEKGEIIEEFSREGLQALAQGLTVIAAKNKKFREFKALPLQNASTIAGHIWATYYETLLTVA